MKILALILARGGSKRCPGKNKRLLGGKPLIVWSIDAAKGVTEIQEIMISTDDSAIADVARTTGVLVPWLRPPELATDTADTIDVAIHALDWYESERGVVDALLLLQPTSPFRTTETIRRGIELFTNYDVDSVVGVTPTHAHPAWTFTINNNRLVPYNKKALEKRSQELVPAFFVNGAFYLTSKHTLRAERTFFPNNTMPLEMHSQKEALDIDNEWDFKFAETMITLSDI